jgi:hypothetical protein
MEKTLFYTAFTLLPFSCWRTRPRPARSPVGRPPRGSASGRGVASGRLTTAEARVLKKEQRHIRNLKKRFLADGIL